METTVAATDQECLRFLLFHDLAYVLIGQTLHDKRHCGEQPHKQTVQLRERHYNELRLHRGPSASIQSVGRLLSSSADFPPTLLGHPNTGAQMREEGAKKEDKKPRHCEIDYVSGSCTRWYAKESQRRSACAVLVYSTTKTYPKRPFRLS